MVIGHRGGFFGPENSMKGFQGAIDNKLEGIEFDVWLSKDNVPMVLHGGSDGQLSLYGLGEERVFQWTQEELQSRIDIGEGEKMPTLEALLKLCDKAPDMLLNIELKGPLDEAWVSQYDYNLAARKVIDLIEEYEIGSKTMISSFVPRILDAILAASSTPRSFVVQSLRNRGTVMDPDNYAVFPEMTGINMYVKYLSEDIVNKVVKTSGNWLGVWYVARLQTEGEDMWQQVFSIAEGAVTFFYSDKPLEAMQVRD